MLNLCRKEIQETEYWLELLEEIDTVKKKDLVTIGKDAHELCLIFNKLGSSLKN